MNEILKPIAFEYMSRETITEPFYLVRFFGKLTSQIYRAYYTEKEFAEYFGQEILNKLQKEYEERKEVKQ